MPCRFANRFLGRIRRHKGFYDRTTLRCFASAWAAAESPTDLLRYALFRRDLGKKLPDRWVASLALALDSLPTRDKCMALGLLAESRPDSLDALGADSLSAGIDLPAVASRAPNIAPRFQDLAQIDKSQLAWRQAFSDQVCSSLAAGGVTIIGNAATLEGLKSGSTIDRSGMIVRFNHYMGRSELIEDVGQRTDVWVVSPGYIGPVPDKVSWAIVTGPDMRYRLRNWHIVSPLLEQGVPVLTIPLDVWGILVRKLAAPPSAGILTLAWLNTLAHKNWQGISIAGIGSGLAKGGRYHASLSRHVASTRHAWDREIQLVEEWRRHGLSKVMPQIR